jgi:hypothetical protein
MCLCVRVYVCGSVCEDVSVGGMCVWLSVCGFMCLCMCVCVCVCVKMCVVVCVCLSEGVCLCGCCVFVYVSGCVWMFV